MEGSWVLIAEHYVESLQKVRKVMKMKRMQQSSESVLC